ncbi:hypothetical protein B0H17DRAFT_1197639 [Mycena rosella]|uniref:Uncharacterized protein n=1 Tax=Mycena rosella TaxID=1033263 RepID=A0AAD7GIZ8_MYCRO|nr:hypothetical protein B0H17DRAFT_1197639 [Mycena rosella]
MGQETILNVLKCMPDDLWEITEIGDDLETFNIRLLRAVTTKDWERALFYLHRVKFFSAGGLQDADFLETLSLCPPGQFFFPMLEVLHWYPEPVEAFHHLLLFLTPSIKDITLGGIQTISHLSILSTLPDRCPALIKVAIYIHGVGDLALPTISTLVPRLQRLESLVVPGLDEIAFAHIARLPCLKSLRLNFESPWQLPGEVSGFEALTELIGPTLESSAALIAMVPNRPFLSITVRPHSLPPTDIMSRQFYSAVGKHCAHSSLREITVCGTYPNPDIPSDQIEMYSVGLDILSPLLSFPNLVRVDLVHPTGFDLDDIAVLRIARAWPRVELVWLKALNSTELRSRVTLEGLYAFARFCPSLRRLAVTFDATVVPQRRDSANKERVAQSCLTSLDVALSHVTHPHQTAQFLSTIFPRLAIISTSYEELLRSQPPDEIDELDLEPEVVSCHSLWKQVEELLLQC